MVRATVSGAGEGVAIAANTYTFGATDALGVTDTSQLNESYHNASRVAATVSRDVAIAATGLGAAQKAAQGGQAANVVAKTANAYDKVQDAKDTAGALVAAASGDPTALAVAVVGKAAGSAVGGATPVARTAPDSPPGTLFTADLTQTTARSRSGHRNAGNKQLHDAMEADDGLRKQIEESFGSDAFDRTSTSGRGRRNPGDDARWHHDHNDPNKLRLMRHQDHVEVHRREGRSGGYDRFYD